MDLRVGTAALFVPTDDTSPLRGLGSVAAGLWVAVGVLGVIIAVTHGDGGHLVYVAFSVALTMAASATALVAVIGDRARPVTVTRVAAVALMAVAVLSTVMAWAVPFWMIMIAIGAAVLAATDGVRRTGLLGLAAAQLVGVAVTIAGLEIGVGPTDSHGDHPYAFALGIATAALLTCAALWQLETSRPAIGVGGADA